ncbi:hypothetical protein [Galbibacter orientalis]|uniref:hypothetical protein n=1 Tax=Galbibacter orientalis TaxID=453852 RepID=UPI003080D85F
MHSQYNSFKIEKPYDKYSKINVVQVDFRDYSTLVHLELINGSDIGEYFYINENFILKDIDTNKEYKLLNSFNIPLENSNTFAFTKSYGEKINFTLEFEKAPSNLKKFDLIEEKDSDSAFNIYGIEINKSESTDMLNLNDYIDETPIKYVGYYYKDGIQIKRFIDESGVEIALFLTLDNSYGKYLRANILIKNLSGNTVNINPENITAYYISKLGPNQSEEAKILSYTDYMKKVKRKQNWNAFATAFSESIAAADAGYSSSTTNSSTAAFTSSYGSAYGYNGNTFTSAYGASYSYGNAYTSSQTNSYDGNAAYMAQQNANKNIENLSRQQYQIKKSLSDGYLKRNSIENQTEYIGYINIPSKKKFKKIRIDLPLNGENYVFIF